MKFTKRMITQNDLSEGDEFTFEGDSVRTGGEGKTCVAVRNGAGLTGPQGGRPHMLFMFKGEAAFFSFYERLETISLIKRRGFNEEVKCCD